LSFSTTDIFLLDDATLEALSIAILSIRCGIFVNPSGKHVEALLRSHMGTVYGISNSRREIFVAYGSEPALAEAALHIMYDKQNSFLLKILQQSEENILEYSIDVGEVGEFVASLIFLFAIDFCHVSRAFSPYKTGFLVPVNDFVNELSPGIGDLGNVFDGYFISYSHVEVS
jgi:hypothetical protein